MNLMPILLPGIRAMAIMIVVLIIIVICLSIIALWREEGE